MGRVGKAQDTVGKLTSELPRVEYLGTALYLSTEMSGLEYEGGSPGV